MSVSGADKRHHTLTVLVENKAGVLARVASLFARRGYNIFCLAVAPTDDERFSRITIVVDVESAPLEQIIEQLDKLIPVVVDHRAGPGDPPGAGAAHGHRRGRRRTPGASHPAGRGVRGQDRRRRPRPAHRLLAGAPTKLDDFEDLIRTYGIVEIQRTGRVALPKLDRSGDHGPLHRRTPRSDTTQRRQVDHDGHAVLRVGRRPAA